MAETKTKLTVVVNGDPAVVEVDADAPLMDVMPAALQQTEQTGQPYQNWQLTDTEGRVLDLDRKVSEYGFPENARLLLTWKEGVE
ncbi:MAG: DUF2604 domain-containing protein [Dehalococcoidia bacterium]